MNLIGKRCIWNFGTSRSCGVAILLFNDKIRIENFHSDIYGRLIRLDFSYEGLSNFRIVNVYFPNVSSDRIEFINNLSQHLCGAKHLILGGDFNFVLDTNLDKIGGNSDNGTIGSKPFKTIIDKMSLIDCFRYLYPTKRAVTCSMKNVFGGTSNYEIVGSRFDRFYTSAIFKRDIKSFDTVLCVCSDHDFIILTLSGKNETGITYGKSYWKFNDELLNDCNFVTSFEIFWKVVSRTETIDSQW